MSGPNDLDLAFSKGHWDIKDDFSIVKIRVIVFRDLECACRHNPPISIIVFRMLVLPYLKILKKMKVWRH